MPRVLYPEQAQTAVRNMDLSKRPRTGNGSRYNLGQRSIPGSVSFFRNYTKREIMMMISVRMIRFLYSHYDCHTIIMGVVLVVLLILSS